MKVISEEFFVPYGPNPFGDGLVRYSSDNPLVTEYCSGRLVEVSGETIAAMLITSRAEYEAIDKDHLRPLTRRRLCHDIMAVIEHRLFPNG